MSIRYFLLTPTFEQYPFWNLHYSLKVACHFFSCVVLFMTFENEVLHHAILYTYLIWMSDELMAKYWHLAYNVKNNKICKAFLSSLFLVRYVCMYVFSCPNDVQWNDFNIPSLLSMTASEQNVTHKHQLW